MPRRKPKETLETTEAERGGGELEVGEAAGDDLRGGVDAVEADHGGVGDNSPDLGAVHLCGAEHSSSLWAPQQSRAAALGSTKMFLPVAVPRGKSFKSCF